MKVLLFSFLFALSSVLLAQPVVREERGPWTLSEIADGIYNIQDYTAANPRGFQLDAEGNRTGMNNASDIYLLVGSERALMIDLSNPHSEAGADEALRRLVYDRVGNKPLYITATHFHGDHLGMLPAFTDDDQAYFWVSRGEFADRDIFPWAKSTLFGSGAALDLGGIIIDTFTLPGHTPSSTLFFVRGRNLVFTGDAMGSGIGVWLFDYDSLLIYRDSIGRLLAYLDQRGVDQDALRIHSSHTWQYPGDELTVQYIRDMQTLMEKMAAGEVAAEDYAVQIPFLDATFTYGVATITWNRAAALRLAMDPGVNPPD